MCYPDGSLKTTMMKGKYQGRRLHAVRQFLGVLAVLLCGVLGKPAHAQAAAPVAADFHPHRILIVPKAAKGGDTAKMHKQKGRKVLKRFEGMKNLEIVELPAGEDVLTAVEEYNASGAVEFAEPDYILHASLTPDDPRFLSGSQYGLNSVVLPGAADPDINAPEGWEIRHDAPDIIVAIVDSGLRLTHEDLAPNLWTNPSEIPDNGIDDDGDGYIDDVHGINSITGSGSPVDDVGHGTHVAGIIGAAGNNGKGITGVAWKVQLMPLKFIGSSGDGLTSDAIECINYAWRHGASVINASFGNTSFSSSMQTAILSARNAGVILVAAAGNENTNNDLVPSYPANYTLDNVVSVAATTSSDVLDTSYSNYGATTVDLGAPGTGILSCGYDSNSSYVLMSGTSMATPVVVGVIALMRAQFPNASHTEIIQRLLATVDPVPTLTGKSVSGGRVNLQKALSPFVHASFTSSVLAGTVPLTVNFTNISFGEIASFSWNFGDGSPVSTELKPTHVYAFEGSYTVTLTVVGLNGIISTYTQTVNVVPTYNYSVVDYVWIDPTSMRRLFMADNGVSSAEALPFAFKFYGQTQTEIYVGANGLLGFDPANMSTTSNTDLPTAASPNGTILPYWDNLNPASVGAIYIGAVGQAPNRQFVVSWVGVTRNSSTDTITFQAVLQETGEIRFNYQEVRPASSRGGGLRATVGVEDPSGLVATKYCYNGAPNRVSNSQSILFSVKEQQPARFKSSSIANGVFHLELDSITGLTFIIESSGDLHSWTEVKRGIVGADGIIPFTEAAAPDGNHFFRAQVQSLP